MGKTLLLNINETPLQDPNPLNAGNYKLPSVKISPSDNIYSNGAGFDINEECVTQVKICLGKKIFLLLHAQRITLQIMILKRK